MSEAGDPHPPLRGTLSRERERVGVRAPHPLSCLVPDLPAADELLPYLRRIDQGRRYTNFGPLVDEFERRLASFLGRPGSEPHCVTVASGTAALELALAALGLPPGSRVLVPAFTFPATASAVLRAGLEPRVADVDPASWALAPEAAAPLIERHRCRAVIPVAVFGCAIDVAGWDAYAAATGIPVLVDAAAGLGVHEVGRHVHTAFSLHATKPMGIGEGGVVVTADGELAERVRRMSNFGFAAGRAMMVGTNAKLSEYAAAVGLAQLERWPRLRALRGALWDRYWPLLRAIDGVVLQRGFAAAPPAVLALATPMDGAACVAALAAEGIEARRWYCPPLHRHPAFAHLEHAGAGDAPGLPVAEALGAHVVGPPFHNFLSPDDLERIAETLRRVLAQPVLPSSGARCASGP